MQITDCHIHIQPAEMFKAGPLEVMKKARGRYDDILEYCRSPKALLKYLDSIGVERAVLINYVAPDTMGFTHEVNQWVADYCKENPRRLIRVAACIRGTRRMCRQRWTSLCAWVYG